MRSRRNEDSFEQVALVELTLEKSRAKVERAAAALREMDGDPHLIEALEQARDDLSESARRLRQATYFAVPEGQTRIEAA